MATATSRSDDFLTAIEEAESRPIRVRPLEVIDNTPKSADQLSILGAPGTMTVFVAKKGARALDDVRAAVTKGGDQNIEKVRTHVRGRAPRRKPVSDRQAAELMVCAPVFADIRYGGDVLNRGVFLPDGFDLVVVVLPYNGGRLARGGFSLAEHFQEGSDAALEGLVVQVSPPLTAAEKAALRQVPPDQRVANVGVAISCRTTWWAVGFVAACLAGVAVLAAVEIFGLAPRPGNVVHLTEQELKKLGPAASARKLLAMRRELLRKQSSR